MEKAKEAILSQAPAVEKAKLAILSQLTVEISQDGTYLIAPKQIFTDIFFIPRDGEFDRDILKKVNPQLIYKTEEIAK